MSVPRGGERRPVTTLFADIVGSTAIAERMDPEEWSDVVAEAVRVMSAVVGRFDGHVDQVLGDGVVAFFGLRVAHEDDPQRAVRAGLEMIDAMRGYSDRTERTLGFRLPIRVGINTGLVVVRELGDGAGRTDVTALGDAVNVAARMESEARPDSVLVTSSTHAFVAASTKSRHVGAISVKGKTDTIDAFEIERWTGAMLRPRGIPGLTSPMVGRDVQLEELLRTLPAVRAGRGRAAIVLGEPGIGKSRLIAELRRSVGSGTPPFAWYEARCLSYGPSVPHHLASGIARSVLGLPAPDLGIDTAPDVDGSPTVPHPVDDPYLAHLLGLEAPPETAHEIARLDPIVLQGRYVDGLHTVIADVARTRPVVIVCEDLHWADPASVDLIRRLLPRLQDLPILLVAAARPDRDVPGWSLVTATRDQYGDVLVELRLAPLSAGDSRTLVANLLEIESLPDATRDYILERADGNPFFMEEVIRMLVDRGAIDRRDGRWVATRTIDPGEIPGTLHGLLLARIDRLDTDARDVLRVAAVIGRRFPVGVLAEAMARR